MEISDINGLDIKTLRLLIAIESQGSLSAAAELRGMTQSTASYGLDKLRAAFGDPIFVRAGRGMTATARGRAIIDHVREILHGLDRLAAQRGFDPAHDAREFAIAGSAFEIETIISPLRRDLAERSPGSRLTVCNLELPDIITRLSGEWDIALMSYPRDTPMLKRVKLMEDEYVTFYDPDATEPPTGLEAFAAAPHAVVTFGGSARSVIDDALAERGLTRRIDLVVQSFESLPPLLKGSPLIITLPKGFDRGLLRDFAHVPPPFEIDPVHVFAVWHMLKDSDPAISWVRKRIRTLTSEL